MTEQEKGKRLADGWRYVTLPKKDLYGNGFDGISINAQHWDPGTHLVPPDIAEELENILDRWYKSMIRILQPQRDLSAVRIADVGLGVSPGLIAVKGD